MKKTILFITCAVAVAGAVMPVYAAAEVDYIQDIQPTPSPTVEIIEDFVPTSSPDLPDQNVDVIPDISSESESLGEFGNDDTTVNDAFQDFIDNVGDSGFDFITASPDPEISPSFSPFPTPTISPLSEDDDTDIYPYANYNTYYGSISSTYLEFMRGFLPKLGFREHYVASRTSQYDYIFAYGEKLTYSGGRFTGTGITVITWNTYNYGTYSFGYQSTFSLNPGSYLVYSDLSDVYPSLADSAGFTLRQILILLTAFILGIVIDHMYQVRKIRRIL
jgi:hypothetical protein